MAAGRPIFHAFRHAIGFFPDDFASKEPPGPFEVQMQPSRGSPPESLGFRPSGVGGRSDNARHGILFVGSPIPSVPACVAIAYVEPEGSIFSENAFHLFKRLNQVLDVIVRYCFGANLSFRCVIFVNPNTAGRLHNSGKKHRGAGVELEVASPWNTVDSLGLDGHNQCGHHGINCITETFL